MWREGDTVCAYVTDDGPGVPAEDWESVFEPFVRIEGRGRSRGSGIGLFAARRLMDAMGGRVWLEPNGYGGSRFVVELPAAPAEARNSSPSVAMPFLTSLGARGRPSPTILDANNGIAAERRDLLALRARRPPRARPARCRPAGPRRPGGGRSRRSPRSRRGTASPARRRAPRASRGRCRDGNGSAVAASVIRPRAPRAPRPRSPSIQSAIVTGLPPRLKTRAPVAAPTRLARSSVFATSSAYWKSVAPPNADPERRAEDGRGDRHGRAARHALVAPGAVDRHRPEADARHAGVGPVDPGGALVGELVDAVVVAGMRRRRPRASRPVAGSTSVGENIPIEPCRRSAPSRSSPRRLTASNTLTVPTTLTRAPSGGSARQNGTCSAARWMTFVMPCSSRRRSSAARSVMSPDDERDLRPSSSGRHDLGEPARDRCRGRTRRPGRPRGRARGPSTRRCSRARP